MERICKVKIAIRLIAIVPFKSAVNARSSGNVPSAVVAVIPGPTQGIMPIIFINIMKMKKVPKMGAYLAAFLRLPSGPSISPITNSIIISKNCVIPARAFRRIRFRANILAESNKNTHMRP